MVKLECSACKKRVMLHVACAKNSSHVLQMLPLECPRVLCPSVSSTFGVRCSVSLSLHVRKGKCPMSPDHKVEIHLPKIRLMDSKCFNSNNPGSCGPLFHPLLGSAVACIFLCMQEKGSVQCRLFIPWKFTFQKLVSWTPNVPHECPRVLEPSVSSTFGRSVGSLDTQLAAPTALPMPDFSSIQSFEALAGAPNARTASGAAQPPAVPALPLPEQATVTCGLCGSRTFRSDIRSCALPPVQWDPCPSGPQFDSFKKTIENPNVKPIESTAAAAVQRGCRTDFLPDFRSVFCSDIFSF